MRKYNRIKDVLKEKGISQTFVAEKLNRGKSTVYRWCANNSQPSIKIIFEIADLIGANSKDLIVDNKSPEYLKEDKQG